MKREAVVHIVKEPALIVPSSEFVKGFVPPTYLIDGILQQGFLYSLTGKTGAGKTAIGLLVTATTSLGQRLHGREINKGQALYFAGENPIDITMRWIAQAQQFALTPEDFEGVHFVSGAYKLSEIAPRIRQEVEALCLAPALVVIDTSAAYFEGGDENSNVEAGIHARRMRELVSLPGRPTVLVNCHPTKNAGDDNLLPRGGGSFVAEVDGNLTAKAVDGAVELHWQGKFRGPDFAPLLFRLKTVTHERLKDSRGRLIPTVVAEALSEQAHNEIVAAARNDEDLVLAAVAANPKGSLATHARALGWHYRSSEPNKSRVNRAVQALSRHKLLKEVRGGYELTEAGRKALTQGQKQPFHP
jgi:hypothetical protein